MPPAFSGLLILFGKSEGCNCSGCSGVLLSSKHASPVQVFFIGSRRVLLAAMDQRSERKARLRAAGRLLLLGGVAASAPGSLCRLSCPKPNFQRLLTFLRSETKIPGFPGTTVRKLI